MSDNTGKDRLTEFREALYTLFDCKKGKIVLDFLQECYVDAPAIDADTTLLAYKLGQKEFVQGLIKDATTKYEDLKTGG